jgi:hypothetical protein
MTEETQQSHSLNAMKSFALAKTLFPQEEWIFTESNIWVAKSRLHQKEIEPKKWEKEMSQIRILTDRGSVAYFLPEVEIKGKTGKRCADLVLDGEILEIKTVSGTRSTLGGEFRLAYKQGAALLFGNDETHKHSVFIRLKTELSLISVMSKIAGELKERCDNGRFICYFETSRELYSWTYDELRAIIRKK